MLTRAVWGCEPECYCDSSLTISETYTVCSLTGVATRIAELRGGRRQV